MFTMKKIISMLAIAALFCSACTKDPAQPDSTTPAEPDEVTKVTCATGEASDIMLDRATVSGTVNAGDKFAIRLFYWSETASDKESLRASGTKITVDGKGPFSATITGLKLNTTYYYMASVTTWDGDIHGEVKSFTTGAFKTTTVGADQITRAKAHLSGGGVFNDAMLGDLSLSGCFYWSATQSTAEGLRSSGEKLVCPVTEDASIFATISGLSPNTTYYFVAALTVAGQEVLGEVKSFKTNPLPAGAVDLGLSVLWADCNLGSKSPTGLGTYYAWGETSTKSSFSKENYSFYDTARYYEKGQVLPKNRDAAAQIKGGGWRMPTEKEIEELIDKHGGCSQSWTDNNNGVPGIWFTGKRTGNKIFLPAGGVKQGSTTIEANVSCYYWTGSFCFGNNGTEAQAYAFTYYSKRENASSAYFGDWGNYGAWNGLLIRPVID